MAKYYKQIDSLGNLSHLLTYDFNPIITDPLIVEITVDEYNRILAELEAAFEAAVPDKVKVSEGEVPPEAQEPETTDEVN